MARKEESLLIWVNQFEGLEGARSSLDDLCDGIALAEIVGKLIPNYMTDSKLEGMERATEGNTKLKELNLRKLWRCLKEFYEEDLKAEWAKEQEPDVKLIAEGDKAQVVRLMEMVLGCAVQCDSKEEQVTAIMGLEQSVKEDLMEVLQNIMMQTQRQRSQSASDSFVEDAPSSATDDEPVSEDARKYKAEAQEAAQRYKSLRAEYDEVLRRLSDAESALQDAHRELTEISKDDSGDSDKHRQQIHELSAHVEELEAQLQLERQDAATSRQDYERAINQMKRQMDKATAEAAEAKALRDEVDDLRGLADQVPILQDRIENYKRKLEIAADWQDLKTKLEEENTRLTRKVLELEEASKHEAALRAQNDELKQQKETLEAQLSEERSRGDRAEVEASTYLQQVQRLKADKEGMLQKMMGLQRQIDDATVGDFSANTDAKRVVELEHQLETLQAQLAGKTVDHQVAAFKEKLEEAQKRKETLESENRQQNKRIYELETELKMVKESEVKTTSDKVFEQLATSERELRKVKEELEESSKQNGKLKAELESVQTEFIELKKSNSMVGLEQAEMIEKARQDARAEVSAKLEALSMAEEELEQLKAKVAALEKERNELQTSHMEDLKRITKILEEKDELSSKLQSASEEANKRIMAAERRVSEAEVTARERERELKEVRGKLDMAREGFKEQEQVLKQAAAPAASADVAAEVEQLKKQLEGEKARYDRLRRQYEREEKLITTAWHEMAQQNLRMGMRLREVDSGRAGDRPGGADTFLHKQRAGILGRE